MINEQPEFCYDCKQITSRKFADGTTQYGCLKTPGLITGFVGAFEDDDEPIACDDKE